MNALALPLSEQVAALLLSNGAMTVAQLQAATGKSQPSLSLAITRLGARVCRLGAARSSRYALAQPIWGLSARQQLTLTTAQGDLLAFGDLTYLHGQQTHVRAARGKEWLTAANKLPWFLEPLRPQGFLGRQLVRLAPHLPSDPDVWSAEQVLNMAALHAADPPGAFSLGALAVRQLNDSPAHYDTLARSIGSSLPAASSAGGEQPKFVTKIGDAATSHQHVIVKFSPPRGTPFGERWHELLHLEHLALTVLQSHGIPAASTRIVESKERTYLESQRFDRIGMMGKRHVVAAASVHEEFVKTPRQNWAATCAALAGQKRLPSADLKSVACQYFFGQFIGNTDMHFGNLSFFVDDVANPNFTVTPAYDMLPMMWRPGVHTGELYADPIRPQPRMAGFAQEANDARDWAIDYWERATKLQALSGAVLQACRVNIDRLKNGFG